MPQLNPRLIVYGGTFDPPHEGHRQCVDLVATSYPDATILIIPALLPPNVANGVKPAVASYKHRLELCNLAFADSIKIFGNNVCVSDIESQLPQPSYTVRTLEHLAAKYRYFDPGELAFAMGLDQFPKIQNWRLPERILTIASLIVVERQPLPSDLLTFARLSHELATAIGDHIHDDMEGTSFLLRERRQRIDFLSAHLCPASSHEIRTTLAAHKSPPRDWLKTSVLEYLKDHGLYSQPL